MDSDAPAPSERSLKLPTLGQQFKAMDAVRFKLLPSPSSSGLPLAQTGRCSVSLRLLSTLHSKHERISLEEMEARAHRELTLEAVSGLHAAQKAIEDRFLLINAGHLVCIECGVAQPHHVALQARLVKVHGPKRLRKASIALLKEHAPEALRIKTERYASMLAYYEGFCAEEARLRMAQVNTVAKGPPWLVPPLRSFPLPIPNSPPPPSPFPPSLPADRSGAYPIQARAPCGDVPDKPYEPIGEEVLKILLDIGPERLGHIVIPCPPERSFQATISIVGNTLGVPGESLLLKDISSEATPITDSEGLDRAQRVAVSLSLPPFPPGPSDGATVRVYDGTHHGMISAPGVSAAHDIPAGLNEVLGIPRIMTGAWEPRKYEEGLL